MNIQGLSVQVHGGSGPHLLLVHGMLASRAQFLHNIAALETRFTPVTAELLGHNHSESPSDQAPYQPDGYIEAFEAIRIQLGVERWFIGGCSLGAALTMNYVLAHQDKVLSQVFTNSSSAFADSETLGTWQANAEASYLKIREGGMKAINRIPVHPRYGRRIPEEIRDALIHDGDNHSVEGIAMTMRWTSPFGSIRDRISEFHIPSLLVCGRFEKRFKDHRVFAEEHMENLDIVDLDAGHGVNMEAATEFNSAVLGLLDRADC